MSHINFLHNFLFTFVYRVGTDTTEIKYQRWTDLYNVELLVICEFKTKLVLTSLSGHWAYLVDNSLIKVLLSSLSLRTHSLFFSVCYLHFIFIFQHLLLNRSKLIIFKFVKLWVKFFIYVILNASQETSWGVDHT